MRAAVDAGFDVVLTTGGTGLSPPTSHPRPRGPSLEREAPGIAEAVRRFGEPTGAHVSSVRGHAGIRRTHADREPALLDRRGAGRAGGARPAPPARGQPAGEVTM